MDNKTYVYSHSRPDGTIFYIGIGSKKRVYTRSGRNELWHRIVNKDGGYNIDIIHKNVSREFAIQKEIELIEFYGRIDLKTGTLCNMTSGGEGIVGRSDECLEKIRQSSIGRKWSESKREKMIPIMENHSRHYTEEVRKKMSEAKTGTKRSEETKDKISQARLGTKLADSAIQKLKNRKSPACVAFLNLETGIYYESLVELSKTYGLTDRCMSNRLKNGKYNNILRIGKIK